MKITGSTKVDLSLSNFDYEIGIFTNSNQDSNIVDLGLSHINENKKTKNCANLESKLGPLNLKVTLLSDEEKIPENIENLDLDLTATIEIENDFNMGLKYQTNGSQTKYEILSGLIDTKLNLENVGVNLYSENIIYGYKYNENTKINLFGNKIKPSLCLLNDSINIGFLHNQSEEIDEYGNKSEDSKNNLTLDLDFKI